MNNFHTNEGKFDQFDSKVDVYLKYALQISVEQWRSPSWATRAFPSRLTGRRGSSRQESSKSSTKTERRCSHETGWGNSEESYGCHSGGLSSNGVLSPPIRPLRTHLSHGRTSWSTTSPLCGHKLHIVLTYRARTHALRLHKYVTGVCTIRLEPKCTPFAGMFED